MIIGHTGWVPKAERTKSKGPPTRSRGPEDASRLSIFSFFKFVEECEMVELGKLLQLRESVAVKEWKRRLRHFFPAPIISHFLFILARIHPPESWGVLRGQAGMCCKYNLPMILERKLWVGNWTIWYVFAHLESGGHVEDFTTLGSFDQNLIKVEKTKWAAER